MKGKSKRGGARSPVTRPDDSQEMEKTASKITVQSLMDDNDKRAVAEKKQTRSDESRRVGKSDVELRTAQEATGEEPWSLPDVALPLQACHLGR